MNPSTSKTARFIKCIICDASRASAARKFFRFPQDPMLKSKWVEFCVSCGVMYPCDVNHITRRIFICELHFLKDDVGQRKLRKNAIPKIYISEDMPDPDVNQTNENVDILGEDSSLCRPTCLEEVSSSKKSCGPSTSQKPVCKSRGLKRKLATYSSTDMEEPEKAKRMRRTCILYVSNTEKKIKVLRDKCRRVKKKVRTLKSVLHVLRKKHLLSENAMEHLLDSVPSSFADAILIKLKKKKKGKVFSPEIRKFALTLQFYSAKAYEYVRKTWGNLFPHPSTIRNWYSALDGRPGFTGESLKALKIKVSSQSPVPVICNLVLDEMKIREQIIWDQNRFYGTVDMGTDLNPQHEDAPTASYALVFMLVGLNQAWKLPIGYFMIKSLNSDERANLLIKCYELLGEVGVIVNSITFDGASSNLAMVKRLGADFTNVFSPRFQPHFKNPITNETQFVFLDPCHMVKLIRNIFGDLKILQDGDGGIIRWEYIKKIVELQDKEGFHVANKLKKKHIDYNNNRMSVKLAVQVLSESTYNTLIYLQQKNIEGFEDVGPTAKFCQMINSGFDILNCHSKFANKNSFNMPLNFQNTQVLKQNAGNVIEYISKLADGCGQLLLNHPRKTGILGMIVALTNIFPLYEILREKGLEYLLTFKLSQDFIETFFSAVRARGGWNNNPNSKQFESAYKRLLIKNEIQSSAFSNCLEDGVDILYVSSQRKRYLNPIGENVEGDDADDEIALPTIPVNINSYTEDIVKYIGGAIVGKLKYRRFVECNICLQQIISVKNPNTSLLTNLKNRGSYIFPSDEVHKLCLLCETTIKGYESQLLVIPNISQFLLLKILRTFGTPFDNLQMNAHVLNQMPLDSHRIQLAKLIIQFYIKIRLFHYGALKSQKDNMRQRYNRLVLFQGK